MSYADLPLSLAGTLASSLPHFTRVFVDKDGSHGNSLATLLDGPQVPRDQRQQVAARIALSETVFVEDASRGVLRIHTPAVELPFAGHPLLGTAWLLFRRGWTGTHLHPPAGAVPVWETGDLVWLRASPDWVPPRQLQHHRSPAVVEQLAIPTGRDAGGYAWAWVDSKAGLIRARCFAPEHGVPEDEATGSAAIALCSELNRDLRILQGKGSELHLRVGPDSSIELGGRVCRFPPAGS